MTTPRFLIHPRMETHAMSRGIENPAIPNCNHTLVQTPFCPNCGKPVVQEHPGEALLAYLQLVLKKVISITSKRTHPTPRQQAAAARFQARIEWVEKALIREKQLAAATTT